jgi:hypothetical protein
MVPSLGSLDFLGYSKTLMLNCQVVLPDSVHVFQDLHLFTNSSFCGIIQALFMNVSLGVLTEYIL